MKKIAVEMTDATGDVSYFRSVRAMCDVMGWCRVKATEALIMGEKMEGHVLNAVPLTGFSQDSHYRSIQYRIERNHYLGLEELAKEKDVSVAGLVRLALLNMYTEDEIWEAAKRSEDFIPSTKAPIHVPAKHNEKVREAVRRKRGRYPTRYVHSDNYKGKGR